jgi:hypothetical protein
MVGVRVINTIGSIPNDNDHFRPPFQGGFILRQNPGLKTWAMIFNRFAVIANMFASLVFAQSATAAQPSVSNSLSTQDIAIQPGSVVSGYPVIPTYNPHAL